MAVYNIKRVFVRDIAYISIVGVTKTKSNNLRITGISNDIALILNGGFYSIDGHDNLFKRGTVLKRSPITGFYNNDGVKNGDICAIDEISIWPDSEENVSFSEAKEIIENARRKISERNNMMYSSDFIEEPDLNKPKGKVIVLDNFKKVIGL